MKNEMKRSRYQLNLQHFAEGDADPDPNPTPDPTPDKTFTQADLDRIVADRLARDRKGREDYDDIKTKLTALERSEADRAKAEMTAAERLEAEKAEALKKAQEAEDRSTARETAANQRIINAEFKSLAREANVPADRLAAALKLADLSAVTVDDEGNAVGVKEAVEALVSAHIYLVEKTQPKPLGGRSGGEDVPDKTKEQLLKEAAEKARKTGRIEDRMAYSALKDELNK
ncbi:scaffolding protein [Paenibacillus sp.]|uniref:phage scaffolding protein n=1 Tax=Paenibacillus sp. TaxID=58172 RepID=UPI0028AFABFF|nr:scaffolding protein [Paenibacillus sp.]